VREEGFEGGSEAGAGVGSKSDEVLEREGEMERCGDTGRSERRECLQKQAAEFLRDCCHFRRVTDVLVFGGTFQSIDGGSPC
jgi:hypothetical protein